MPADHHIQELNTLSIALATAERLAQNGFIVCFGIKPNTAHTGYGYIAAGDSLLSNTGCSVEKFIEKPDKSLAEALVANGTYLWNSGIQDQIIIETPNAVLVMDQQNCQQVKAMVDRLKIGAPHCSQKY